MPLLDKLRAGARNGAFFIAEKREVIMRKLYAAILSAAICLAVSGAPAWASEQQATLRPAATRHRVRLQIRPFAQSPCCRQPERLLRRAGALRMAEFSCRVVYLIKYTI